MAIKHLSDKLTQAARSFGGAQSGNVILTFALAIVPLMGFVGAAVDYSRANSDKAAMQAAMDATALMLSKNVATLTTTQMNQKATDYFNTLFTRTDATNVVITPTYTNTAGLADRAHRNRPGTYEIHEYHGLLISSPQRVLHGEMGQ